MKKIIKYKFFDLRSSDKKYDCSHLPQILPLDSKQLMGLSIQSLFSLDQIFSIEQLHLL